MWAADNAKAEAEIAARAERARLDGEALLRNNILLGERRAVEESAAKAEDEALLKVRWLNPRTPPWFSAKDPLSKSWGRVTSPTEL